MGLVACARSESSTTPNPHHAWAFVSMSSLGRDSAINPQFSKNRKHIMLDQRLDRQGIIFNVGYKGISELYKPASQQDRVKRHALLSPQRRRAQPAPQLQTAHVSTVSECRSNGHSRFLLLQI